MELVYGGWVVRRKSWDRNNWYILLAISQSNSIELCTNNPDGTKAIITSDWIAQPEDEAATDWVIV